MSRRVFEIKQLLYAEKFTVAGAREKIKQNKKKETLVGYSVRPRKLQKMEIRYQAGFKIYSKFS